MKRKILILIKLLFLGLTVMVMLFVSWMIYIVEYRGKSSKGYEVVIDANPAALQKNVFASYTGLHPRLKKRPMDLFPYPIKIGDLGPVQPLFAGELQYPLLCGTSRSKLGQPIIDNHQGYGTPIFKSLENEGFNSQDSNEILGYSQNCLATTRAEYFYKQTGSKAFLPLSEANGDIEKITFNGKQLDFVVRLETGTINRFIYAIAVLRGPNEIINTPNPGHWNKRLVYQFRGGIGIGHKQGYLKKHKVLERRVEQLRAGYAVIYSTGNQTSNHYNIWLAEDTALRVKRQFISLYGNPDYTVGIGGSGGAIQQYLIGQNNPQLLDAIIPLYSYPDMVSQTIGILDCELQEYYFDVTDRDSNHWKNWRNRSHVQGFNASEGEYEELTLIQKLFSMWQYGHSFNWDPGKTECARSWRPMGSLVNNPRYFHYEKYFSSRLFDQVDWTHWDDLKSIYGTDEDGNALRTWDNVGVQYGLEALKKSALSIDEFLKLNTRIGSWKPSHQMQREKFWIFSGDYFPLEFSIWGNHNMQLLKSTNDQQLAKSAPRGKADIRAIEAAYRSGMLFVGAVNLPIIDIRHYLEADLDMHHSIASFSSRQRIIDTNGHADNQVIWMAEKPFEPTKLAFEQLDRWLANINDYPHLSIAEAKPPNLKDACFSATGKLIALGDGVWDGAWNKSTVDGPCQTRFPSFSSPRQAAGASIRDDIFKCALMPVADAIESGIYGNVDMQPHQDKLAALFRDGVCDYRLPDQGRPFDLWQNEMQPANQIGE